MAMSRAEELTHDIASALPAEVVQAYNPTGDFAANQLVLDVGELVWVLEQHESGWWGGHKEGDTKMGWFPKAIVRLARSQSQQYSPVCTNDRRAVASPMGARRSSMDLKLQAMQDKQAELLDFNRKLEEELETRSKDLELERRRRCDEADEYKAKHGQMLKQLEVLAGELDKAKHDFRQREASYVERCRELDAEVKQLREELRRKEAEHESTHHQQQQQQPQQQQPLQQMHAPGARAPSADVPRRLFDGNRTPPVTLTSQSGASGSMTAASPVSISTYPAIPTGTVTALLSSSGSTSGRPASVAAAATTSSLLSRASPRTAASAPGLTWVQQQQQQPPQPPSPHHLHRFAPSPEVPQVRSLVSEFERRSNSQGPGCSGAPPRMDPSPSRQYFVAGTNRPTGVATSRSGSRDVHYHRGTVQAAEAGEETIPFSFGMSPMQRQVHTMPTPGRPQTIVTSSPQPTVSVQDRIRQFTGVPMPMRR